MPDLSPRQLQILTLIADGNTNREIGQILYLSETTVKEHVKRLFDRLGVNSRPEAVAHGFRAGVLR